jgi:uncharacterized protein (TIGR00255 family)
VIKSMTGFAAATREDERATVSVTVRSVNHRHLDLQLRMPSALAAAEADLRAVVARHVARGRVEISVSVQTRETPSFQVEVNEAFCDALTQALETARSRGLVAGALAPGDLLRLPQALAIREQAAAPNPDAEADLAARVRGTVEEALADLDTMRAREGGHLRADLDERRRGVADLVERIAVAAEEGRAGVEARLAERVKEIARGIDTDPGAIAQEIVRTAARSDISEELARFRAHVAHWGALADAAEPCGRKLDFLLQEMNREVNTMGSKADGLRVSELVIAAKAELEKMREQVQNVE